jgi:DNA-directed RNA polymerase subunit RPC12/RpoP
MDIPFPSGVPPQQLEPLHRFLPPLMEGSVGNLLRDAGIAQGSLLDPFGASPRLVREAAQSGCSILVAVNNPITRFILQHTLNPFQAEELQSALAALASLRKDGGRLEPFVLDLYQTVCARCSAQVIGDYFVWDRELERPVLKGYRCPQCHHSGEEPTSPEDSQRATSYAARGLQHALALDAVAPPGDPYRRHAEAALAVYPVRALYALMTVINKLDQLDLSGRPLAAARALILSALDAANALWSHAEGRQRPKQLIASSRYRETNVWRALEAAVEDWALPGPDIAAREWSRGQPTEPGGVMLFPGSVRDLVSELRVGDVERVVTIVPRPNPAYWSLSVLWSAWLWGREAAAAIKTSLARRRYDWAWTAGAFRTVLDQVRSAMERDAPVLSLVVEADPGFLAAAVAGFERAGYAMTGRAFRSDTETVAAGWQSAGGLPSSDGKGVSDLLRSAMVETLHQRGEPTPYAVLHAAAWTNLAASRRISTLWQQDGNQTIANIGDLLEDTLADQGSFKRMDQNVEAERGIYWLSNPIDAPHPLADRVERKVLSLLRQQEEMTFPQVDDEICDQMRGMLTPERRFVEACLSSYAEEDSERGIWRLREQDRRAVREADAREIYRLLDSMGNRLGYEVARDEELVWNPPSGGRTYRFRVQETATFGSALEQGERDGLTLVMPGGRASLVAEKARRDGRVRAWLKDGMRVLKYRHVRRLAEDSTLRRENLAERLALDPPESQDSQMPLL